VFCLSGRCYTTLIRVREESHPAQRSHDQLTSAESTTMLIVSGQATKPLILMLTWGRGSRGGIVLLGGL
jgi:hypothetical protein